MSNMHCFNNYSIQKLGAYYTRVNDFCFLLMSSTNGVIVLLFYYGFLWAQQIFILICMHILCREIYPVLGLMAKEEDKKYAQ